MTTSRLVSHYEIRDRLGAGGMGVAYRAFDRRLERTVVVKMLRPEFSGDWRRKERFLREARAAATLAHPNICTIHEVGEEKGNPFIVMEYIEGRTLSVEIARGYLEVGRLVRIASEVTGALAEAHRRRIVHRDIKPSNVMITASDRVKVLDFGLAKEIVQVDPDRLTGASTLSEGLTREGTLMGTVAYMSPEQLRGHEVDGRSDIFSLGMVLYELAAGERPFRFDGRVSGIAAILSDDPRRLTTLRPGFPKKLERVIFKCLEKQPERRWQTAEDLLDALQELEGRGPSSLASRLTLKPAIAVLPFSDPTGGDADAYFTDGITSEVIHRLAQQKDFLVISRTSTMQFKGVDCDVREIGRQLGAEAILEGEIYRQDRRCRLTVRLIDAEEGTHLWAERYGFSLEDIFEVQDWLSQEIVRELTAKLQKAEPADAETPESGMEVQAGPATANGPSTVPKKYGPHDLEAYEAYLRAKHNYYKFDSFDNLIAIDFLKKSIDLDPEYAAAYAALANAYLARVERGWETDPQPWIQRAWEAGQKAIRLEPGISEAYSARGLINFIRKRLEEAEADALTALHLNANNDVAHNLLGRVHLQRGELDRATAAFRKAVEINPYYVWCLNDLAMAYGLAGEDEACERVLRRVLEINPDDEGANVGLAALHCLRSDMDEAMAAIERSMEAHPRYPHALPTLVLCLEEQGEHERAVEACRKVLEPAPDDFVALASLGLAHARHGDREELQRTMEHALKIEAFYSAFNLLFAIFYVSIDEEEWAARLLDKARAEGVTAQEAFEGHPLLRQVRPSSKPGSMGASAT